RPILRPPFDHLGYAQPPGSPFLGDSHPPDRTGEIRPRRHAVPQPVEVVCQPRLKLLDRHAISPGRSTVTLHFQPRSPDQPLGNVMRLAWQPRLTHATPPLRLVPFISLDGPAPSLPSHCDTQADHSYYRPVRQRAHAGTPPLAVSAAQGSPAPPRLPRRRPRGAPSHVPNESPDRDHAACMPDPTWAVHGYPPGSSRDRMAAPVS